MRLSLVAPQSPGELRAEVCPGGAPVTGLLLVRCPLLLLSPSRLHAVWFLSCRQSLNPTKLALRCPGGRPGDVQDARTARLRICQSQEIRALSAGTRHGLAGVSGTLVHASSQAAGSLSSSSILGRPPGPHVESLLERSFTAATESPHFK